MFVYSVWPCWQCLCWTWQWYWPLMQLRGTWLIHAFDWLFQYYLLYLLSQQGLGVIFLQIDWLGVLLHSRPHLSTSVLLWNNFWINNYFVLVTYIGNANLPICVHLCRAILQKSVFSPMCVFSNGGKLWNCCLCASVLAISVYQVFVFNSTLWLLCVLCEFIISSVTTF